MARQPKMISTDACRPVGRRVAGTGTSSTVIRQGWFVQVVNLVADCSCGAKASWTASVDMAELTAALPWESDHPSKSWTN